MTHETSGLGLVGLYGLLVLVAALGGGWLPSLFKLTHLRLQISVSFVAGFMLTLALLHMLPHGAESLGGIEGAGPWLLGGFLAMFLVQRFLPFHHHDVEDHESEPHPPPEGGGPVFSGGTGGHLDWLTVALGLSFHSVFDGLAIAAAVAVASANGEGSGWPGLGAALAVALHKPLGALSILTLMTAQESPRRWRVIMNFAFALITPVSAVLFYLAAPDPAVAETPWVGIALVFAAGTFLCVSASDLLPELHFHHHDRFKLTAALVAGILVAWLLGHAEPGHEPDGSEPVGHPHACVGPGWLAHELGRA